MSDPRFLHEAALRLRNAPEFEEFRAWLGGLEAEAVQVMASGEGKTVYNAQGSYNTLQRIKKLLEDAPRVLEKMAQR